MASSRCPSFSQALAPTKYESFYKNSTFERLLCTCYIWFVPQSNWSLNQSRGFELIGALRSTPALRTPHYYGHSIIVSS